MKTGKPLLIAGVPIAGLALHSYGLAAAWTPPHASRAAPRRARRRPPAVGAAPAAAATALPAVAVDDVDLGPLRLTPELAMMTHAFGSIPDEKTRHKQLLHMAARLPPVDDGIRIPANKVPGCLSTVHVDCTVADGAEGGDRVVHFVGDSDGLLTKGLLALLIRGLSGCTPAQIDAVDPQFIQAAKITQSLTPGRNNGFLNMLAVMKQKARAAGTEAEGGAVGDAGDAGAGAAGNDARVAAFDPVEGQPMRNAILATLVRLLKPAAIQLTDTSPADEVESQFALEIVAEAFDGLEVAKRHQVIRMVLGEVLPQIRALEISAKSTSEV